MADELVYTSVARGLKPGSRGFCVVASTAGLSPRTLAVLESLSAYRHLHTPTGEPHPGNPIAWSHFHLPGEGQSILSRIADAGLDYSGRTNKLAHHIVIDHGERSSNGPAAMLSASNLMSTWTGDPRILPARVLRPGQPVTGLASTWQSLAGDAGWAGELARGGFHQPRTIIVPVGVDALALVGEALSLMPPQERWRIGFTTFDNGLPQGVTCHWRFVVAGSPEHQQVQKSGPAGLIDLTCSPGPVPDSSQATMARTGDRSTLPSAAQPAAAPATPNAKTKQTGSASPVSEKVAAFQAKTAAGSDEFTLGPPPAGLPPTPSLPGTRLPAARESKPLPPPNLSTGAQGKGIAFWLVLAAIAGCLMLVVVGGAVWMLMPSLASRTPAKAMSLDEMMEDKPDLPDEIIAEPVDEVLPNAVDAIESPGEMEPIAPETNSNEIPVESEPDAEARPPIEIPQEQKVEAKPLEAQKETANPPERPLPKVNLSAWESFTLETDHGFYDARQLRLVGDTYTAGEMLPWREGQNAFIKKASGLGQPTPILKRGANGVLGLEGKREWTDSLVRLIHDEGDVFLIRQANLVSHALDGKGSQSSKIGQWTQDLGKIQIECPRPDLSNVATMVKWPPRIVAKTPAEGFSHKQEGDQFVVEWTRKLPHGSAGAMRIVITHQSDAMSFKATASLQARLNDEDYEKLDTQAKQAKSNNKSDKYEEIQSKKLARKKKLEDALKTWLKKRNAQGDYGSIELAIESHTDPIELALDDSQQPKVKAILKSPLVLARFKIEIKTLPGNWTLDGEASNQ